MKKSFKAEFREDHIHIELASDYEVKPEKRAELWRIISELCKKHNSRRVLVEGFVPEGELETSEVVDAGMHTAAVPKLWLAFCFKNFEPNEQSELFEAIAAGRGVRVKSFSDTETALHWLRVNAPS